MIISRLLEGISSGMFTVASQTYVGALGGASHRARNLYWYFASAALGGIVAPVIGAYATERWGYSAAYVLVIILSLMALIFVLLTVSDISVADGRARPSITTTFRIVFGSFKDRMMIFASFFAATVFLVNMGTSQTAFPLHAQGYLKMSLADIGLITSISSISNFLIQVGAGPLLDKTSRKAALLYGFVSKTIFTFLFIYAGNPFTYTALRIAYGIPMAILSPLQAAFAMDISDPAYRGSYTAVNRVFNDVGYIAGPLLVGAIFDQIGLNAVYILMAIICVVGALTSVFVPKDIKRKSQV